MTSETAEGFDAEGFQAQLDVLSASVARLATLVQSLTPEQLRQPAYPTEWTVADVLSHLGSGATIFRKRLDGDVDTQAIWDEWNAKDPDAQAADALRADAQLQERLKALTPAEAAGIRFAMGPMEIDLTTFLGMRISEHALHTWDIAVTFDASATVPADSAAMVVDLLGMMAGFAGKPTGSDRTVTIRTTQPPRQFEVALRPDSVALTPIEGASEDASAGANESNPDLELSSDALIRLVYGRLDPDHSPILEVGAADLEELRRAFPGF
jgi:uncharacterized protein (TIGR03083 family)